MTAHAGSLALPAPVLGLDGSVNVLHIIRQHPSLEGLLAALALCKAVRCHQISLITRLTSTQLLDALHSSVHTKGFRLCALHTQSIANYFQRTACHTCYQFIQAKPECQGTAPVLTSSHPASCKLICLYIT